MKTRGYISYLEEKVLAQSARRHILGGMKISQIAKVTGCSHRTIQDACARLGFTKVISKDGARLIYDLTREQVTLLRAKGLHYMRGRPRKEKS